MWEVISGIPTSLIIAIAVVLAVGVAALLWYTVFERPIEDAKRDAIKHSHAYIEATQSRLLRYASEYEAITARILQYEAAQKAGQGDYTEVIKGMRGQRAAVLIQIKDESERISEDEIPESVKKILKQVKEFKHEKQDSPGNIGTSTSLAFGY